MQSLYLLGTRQITSLNEDLARLEATSTGADVIHGEISSNDRASILGQAQASLHAFQRTIDDYENMARKELVKEKQEKAEGRITKFRDDYANLRKHLDRLKQSHAADSALQDRNSLLQPTASSSSTQWAPNGLSARRPITQNQPVAESPFTLSRATTPNDSIKSNGPQYGSRTQAALDESSFIQQTGAALDGYIAQGQAVLQNMGSQRDIMKDAQRRLLSAANTLGMSRSTITFIERRSKGDMYILLFGALGTLWAFWMILRYFG